jgi:hypothetical protein
VIAFLVAALLVAPQDTSDLERKLRDTEDRTRREAIQGLAKLATPEAWELVVGALADPKPMVADEAQLALAAAPHELLLGKQGIGSRKDTVQLRATEVIGRLAGPVDGAKLLPLLKSKNPVQRRLALWSLERAELKPGDKKIEPAVKRLFAKDKDAEVRAAALMTLARIVEDKAVVQSALSDKASAVRCAALLASADLATYVSLSGDESLSVRTCVVDGLAGYPEVTSVRALADRLELEPEARLAWRIVEVLQMFSGRKDKRNPAAWRAWADELADDWAPETQFTETDVGERSVAFVGLPILSKRVTFLVDFSGSLWEKRDSGKTRKSVADVELRRALESLPEDALFNVMPYTDDPHPWKKALVPATKKNVQKAISDFEKSKNSGRGDFWDAALAALEDPDVDTIVVLTDGAPTGDSHWNLGLITELFGERNRFRRVTVDALLVDTSRGLQRYWEQLCAASGGRCLRVDL